MNLGTLAAHSGLKVALQNTESALGGSLIELCREDSPKVAQLLREPFGSPAGA